MGFEEVGRNNKAFADDLSLCTENTADADTLLKLVRKFQDWRGLKISTKKPITTGALYGREDSRGKRKWQIRKPAERGPALLRA